MRFEEAIDRFVRLEFDGGSVTVLITASQGRFVDALLLPSSASAVLVFAELSPSESAAAYRAKGVFSSAVARIDAGLHCFLIVNGENADFRVTAVADVTP